MKLNILNKKGFTPIAIILAIVAISSTAFVASKTALIGQIVQTPAPVSTPVPTVEPTSTPTPIPTPTASPSATPKPTVKPTVAPTATPQPVVNNAPPGSGYSVQSVSADGKV